MPEHVDALLSDLGIDTEEASQVRVALLSAAPGVSTVITGMRSVSNVDATRRQRLAQLVSAGATRRKVRAHCRGTGLGWEPRPGQTSCAPVTAVRPLRISVRGALGCGVRL